MRGLIHNCCSNEVSKKTIGEIIELVLLRPVALLSFMLR